MPFAFSNKKRLNRTPKYPSILVSHLQEKAFYPLATVDNGRARPALMRVEQLRVPPIELTG
jgi:hypothetical protein